MTRAEMTDLIEFIMVACPQQKINRATAVAWYEIIGDLEFGAARNAVIAVKHSQAFVDTSDIIREVDQASRRRAHPSERTAAEAIAASSLRELDAGPFPPPNEDYRRAKQEMLATLALRDTAAMQERPAHPPVSAAERHAAYRVKCPWCSTQPGSRCVNTVAGTPKDEPHPARLAEARLEAAEAAEA